MASSNYSWVSQRNLSECILKWAVYTVIGMLQLQQQLLGQLLSCSRSKIGRYLGVCVVGQSILHIGTESDNKVINTINDSAATGALISNWYWINCTILKFYICTQIKLNLLSMYTNSLCPNVKYIFIIMCEPDYKKEKVVVDLVST